MFYAWDITIPADTSEAEPIEQYLSVSKGVVTKVNIKFAPGCHGYVKMRILRHEQQIVPLSRAEWVRGDDETVEAEPMFELDDVPYRLKFVGCSPDSDYPHTISVRINVLPKALASLISVVQLLEKIHRRLFGR